MPGGVNRDVRHNQCGRGDARTISQFCHGPPGSAMKLIEGRRSARPLRSVGDQLERIHPNESTWLANDPCLLALKVAPAGQVGQLRSQAAPRPKPSPHASRPDPLLSPLPSSTESVTTASTRPARSPCATAAGSDTSGSAPLTGTNPSTSSG